MTLSSKDPVNGMLANRFYVGDVEYEGGNYPRLHEPILSRDLFDCVQEPRRRRRYRNGLTARDGSRVYPLTGVPRCARCGWPMREANSAGFRYYRDPTSDHDRDCDQRMARAEDAGEQPGNFLKGPRLPAT